MRLVTKELLDEMVSEKPLTGGLTTQSFQASIHLSAHTAGVCGPSGPEEFQWVGVSVGSTLRPRDAVME